MNDWARPVLIAGVGSELSGDDAAGLLVARRLRESLSGLADVCVVETSDLAGLITRWREFATVVIVDAMRSGRAPGTVLRMDVDELGNAPTCRFTSTHGFGVLDAIELARQLGALPPNLIVYGIEASPSPAKQSRELSTAIEDIASELAVAALGRSGGRMSFRA